MTLEQIDIAIAEHLGWSDVRVGEGARIWGNRPNSAGQDYRKAAVPQFHAKLDDMHYAETVLTYEQFDEYYIQLSTKMVRPFHSTAAQRSEAFLRTIGKWQDEIMEDDEEDEVGQLSTHVSV